jgi:dipeptidyl aminopeptidase/acylaminoacyl peptidase
VVSSFLIVAGLASAIVPIAKTPTSDADPCVLPNASVAAAVPNSASFTTDDQVGLVDIGPASVRGAGSIVTLSPDRQHLATITKQANPGTNSYCLKLLVLPVDGMGAPREVDVGGEFINADFSLRGFSVVKAGWERDNPPLWSPDGTRIAFLKRVDGSTQAWMADPTGRTQARQVSFLSIDVDRLAWRDDGLGLVLVTRPDIRRRAEEIAAEAPRGFLYDDRFNPQVADRPIPTGPIAFRYSYLSLAEGSVRQASGAEVALLEPPRPKAASDDETGPKVSPSGHSAWLERKIAGGLLSPRKLMVALKSGQSKVCEREECEGVQDLWWSENGETLYGLQFMGWAKNEMAFLRWDMADNQPRQLFTTRDAFAGCVLSGREFICGREGAAQPRRIVAIDVETGRERIIFDPNAGLAKKSWGGVQRLLVRNEFGTESFADLVLPPDHKPGQKHPLVVVQYTSHGFLRGGIGDEVPIHPLANRGFAVLSFSRPNSIPGDESAKSNIELMQNGRKDWIDRRHTQSALEEAVRLAIDTGAVDPDRMGISGFSDGTVTTQWALINSDLFKVASLGSCCEDMNFYAVIPGPRFTQQLQDSGMRLFEPGIEDLWRPVSLLLNVERVKVPILIQNTDNEYKGGLDVLATYRHHGRPIELYVFEDETHFKFQPAHRQAIYERNVEWFEFWLMNRVNCSADRELQYVRWKAMAGAPADEDLRCN